MFLNSIIVRNEDEYMKVVEAVAYEGLPQKSEVHACYKLKQKNYSLHWEEWEVLFGVELQWNDDEGICLEEPETVSIEDIQYKPTHYPSIITYYQEKDFDRCGNYEINIFQIIPISL